MRARLLDWKVLLSGTCLAIVIWIGDVLLVSASSQCTCLALTEHTPQVYRCYVICVDYWWVALVPGATSVCALGGSRFYVSSILTITQLPVTQLCFPVTSAPSTTGRLFPRFFNTDGRRNECHYPAHNASRLSYSPYYFW